MGVGREVWERLYGQCDKLIGNAGLQWACEVVNVQHVVPCQVWVWGGGVGESVDCNFGEDSNE